MRENIQFLTAVDLSNCLEGVKFPILPNTGALVMGYHLINWLDADLTSKKKKYMPIRVPNFCKYEMQSSCIACFLPGFQNLAETFVARGSSQQGNCKTRFAALTRTCFLLILAGEHHLGRGIATFNNPCLNTTQHNKEYGRIPLLMFRDHCHNDTMICVCAENNCNVEGTPS